MLQDDIPDLFHLVRLRLRSLGLKIDNFRDPITVEDVVTAAGMANEAKGIQEFQ